MNIPYLKPIAIGVLLTAWAGSIWYAREDRAAEVYAEWDRAKTQQAEQARQTAEDKLEQYKERIGILEKVAKDAEAENQTLKVNLATANDLAGRLRTAKALAELALARRSDSSVSNPSVPASAPTGVSTDELLRRINQAEEDYDRLATASAGDSKATRIAGEACIRQYNEIRNTQNKGP